MMTVESLAAANAGSWVTSQGNLGKAVKLSLRYVGWGIRPAIDFFIVNPQEERNEEMKRYRKREPNFEAEQFLPEEGKPLPEGVTCLGSGWQLWVRKSWLSMADDGVQFPKPGDYIVRSTEGEVFCMSEHDFNRTFVDKDRKYTTKELLG